MDDNIGDVLSRKIGPLPIGAWIGLLGAVIYVGYRMAGSKGSTTGGNNPTSFTSSLTQSGTTPTGGQYSSSYSAQGSGPSPGNLTYGASPMPYANGDTYLNLTVPNNTIQPAAPPSTGNNDNHDWNNGGDNISIQMGKPWYPPGMTSGFWYTTPRPMYPQTAAEHAYNIGYGDVVSMAYDAVMIMLANPQIKLSNNDIIPAGTKLFVPGLPGPPGNYNITGDPNDPDQGKPYIPPPVVPIPQTTIQSGQQ